MTNIDILAALAGDIDIPAEIAAQNTAQIADNDALLAEIADLAETRKNCSRCGGTGHIPGFNHVEGGRCFRCN